ncbi:MAG TPA: hypothetical protein VHR45_00955 [Thermoanaerobaculia bacterium]|nr:hypothetical protein [Thermoanaerobaculia bacterium]
MATPAGLLIESSCSPATPWTSKVCRISAKRRALATTPRYAGRSANAARTASSSPWPMVATTAKQGARETAAARASSSGVARSSANSRSASGNIAGSAAGSTAMIE